MKIVYINRYFYPDHSATSQILTDLVFGLSEQYPEIHIVTSRMLYDNHKEHLLSYENINKVHVHRIWTFRFGRQKLFGRAFDYLTFYLSSIFYLIRFLSKNDIVISKTDPPLISVPVALVAEIKGAKLINWIQDLFPEVAQILGVRALIWPFPGFLKALRNYSLRTAYYNVVIGDSMKNKLLDMGVSENSISVITNWSDGNCVKPIQHGNNVLRTEWGLYNKFVVTYSGNMGRAHDFTAIIEAAEMLNKERDICFLFIGGGAKYNQIQNEVTKRGLYNVQFKPYQHRNLLSKGLGVADLHLISLQPNLEGLIIPSKLYGIMAAGRASIYLGDPSGEVARVLEEEECGFGAISGEDLANKILHLKNNYELCEYMGRNARNAFERRFDKSYAIQKWEKLLTEIATKNER